MVTLTQHRSFLVGAYALSIAATITAGNQKGSDRSRTSHVLESPGATEFKSWCSEVSIGLHGLHWVTDESGGRKTVAATALDHGDPVLSVPLSAVMNVEHALSDPVVGNLWQSDATADLSELDIMAGYLIYERFKPSTSRWQSYLDFFPSQYPTNPLFFHETELDQFKGLFAEAFIRQRRAEVNASFEAVATAITIADSDGVFYPRGRLTRQRFMWAVATLRSRSHLISIKDGSGQWQKAMCLVPGADMLNMAVDPSDINVECATDASSGFSLDQQRFQCRTTREIAEGEELLTVYAGAATRRTNSRLLLEYGFVPAHNPNFAVEVKMPQLEDIKDNSLNAALQKLPKTLVLDPLGWTESDGSDTFVRNFLFYFRAQVAIASEQWVLSESGETLFRTLTDAKPLSVEHERATVKTAIAFLNGAKERLGAYDPVNAAECSAESLTAAQRLRSKELAVVDGVLKFLKTYEESI